MINCLFNSADSWSVALAYYIPVPQMSVSIGLCVGNAYPFFCLFLCDVCELWLKPVCLTELGMENKPLGFMERKMLNVLTFFLIFFEALIHLKMSLFFLYNFQFLTFSLQMAKFPYDKEISLQVEALMKRQTDEMLSGCILPSWRSGADWLQN